jgi:hypothetical protein
LPKGKMTVMLQIWLWTGATTLIGFRFALDIGSGDWICVEHPHF